MHADKLDQVFEKHFAPRESGGKYFQMTSDDGAVTCYFYYNGVGQKGPPVQVKGVDVLTGDKDPVLGPDRAVAIVLHRPAEPWQPPAPPDRRRLVKPAEPGARRGLPSLPELAPGSSLGPAAAELTLARSTIGTVADRFTDWAVADCRFASSPPNTRSPGSRSF